MIFFTNEKDHTYQFSPIGWVKSPFKERYGIPRQSGLAKHVEGQLCFVKHEDLKTALKGIELFSHIWVIFVFHQHGGKKWKPSIRPPRLGGRKKMGVLASRSPHRPNPIGISVLKLNSVDFESEKGPLIHVSGLDLLDGTPILDIKPYLPYADALQDSTSGWAHLEIQKISVEFSENARSFIIQQENSFYLENVIRELLELDPRPAYLQRKEPFHRSEYWLRPLGIKILNHEIKYQFTKNGIEVISIS